MLFRKKGVHVHEIFVDISGVGEEQKESVAKIALYIIVKKRYVLTCGSILPP
jgi:hypothetical protein